MMKRFLKLHANSYELPEIDIQIIGDYDDIESALKDVMEIYSHIIDTESGVVYGNGSFGAEHDINMIGYDG